MRGPWGTGVLLLLLLLVSGCINQGGTPEEPRPEVSVGPTPGIRLGDISVGGTALAQRAGLYMCGEKIVASAPAGGIEGDSFVVFDQESGEGEITEVELPRRMRPNARWLLSTRCVEPDDGRPFVAVAYQEMPLPSDGGVGIRAAYSLDGEQLWMRDDLNVPGAVVDDVLVLASTPDQPEEVVDLRTGETLARFEPSIRSRTVVSGDRMVVRRPTGPPVLSTLAGKRVATLEQASFYTADGGLLFGTTPADRPAAGTAPEPTVEEPDAGGSPAPRDRNPRQAVPAGALGEVRAYALRTGRPQWRIRAAPDPLGMPVVEPQTGIVVVVDVDGVGHGIDPGTGREEWRTPTELENPRVTAAAGMVLFDKVEEPLQKLVDARTGLPLPEPQEPVVDLDENGALQIVDGVATVMSPAQLRRPPTSTEETLG